MHTDPGTRGPTDRRVSAAWRRDGAFLVSFAQRMVGSRSEAEDVVQEAWGRRAPRAAPPRHAQRGWLTVVVLRVCLDRLRSAYGRRVAAGLPPTDEASHGEPVGGATGAVDPADRVTLDDQVTQALGVVLGRLTPAERTAFVLHDVFARWARPAPPRSTRSPNGSRPRAPAATSTR